MYWKRALLVVLVLGAAFVLMAAAAIGLAVTSAVVMVAESGVVDPVIDAVSEVVDDAERLSFEVDDRAVSITNLDTGESRIIGAQPRFRGERLEVTVPRITITDPNRGDSQVIVPELSGRLPRFLVENDERVVYVPNHYSPVFAPLGFLFRGVTTLLALALVATGAWLLLRKRRAEEKAETMKSA